MFRSAKEIAFIGVTVALLIGGQLVLSAISGIEIVTVIFAVYCFIFGVFRGVVTATAFSLVRCIVFGFFPQVVVLYLIYYNLFAVVLGLLGKWLKSSSLPMKIGVITLVCVLLTIVFTLIDNLLNIWVLGVISPTVKKIYILQSIPVAITQAVSNAVIVPLLFYPLYKVYTSAKKRL
ncbi:MAG: hypothetical protein E7360_00405 [Clostridiales bacterium]|nr:hypothetical protein [Clostridiales bacterium]